MDTHNSTQLLVELADQVAASAKKISQHLRSKSLDGPTFHPSSAGLPDDPEIREARRTLSIASRALSVLSHDPLSHIRETVLQFNECAALKVIVDWKIAYILNLDGTPMHISEISRKSGADEYRIASALRVLTTQYIFTEVKPNYFAHNICSVHLVREDLQATVGYCLGPLIKGSLKVSEAMRRYPSSTKPEETGFAIGNDTKGLAFFPWLVTQPEEMTRFNICLQTMASSSYERLRKIYPWRALGRAKVVDIGGGNGHISYQIASGAPNLEFVIQDLAQPISEAIESCPENLRPRFSFQVADFMETQKVEADAYFLRLIFHFLSDEDCIKLIRNIVPIMKKNSRILVAESIVPQCGSLPNPMHRYVFNQNWNMIVALNARERTFEEFAKLFYKADPRFRLKQWGEAGGAPSSEIIEATIDKESRYPRGRYKSVL